MPGFLGALGGALGQVGSLAGAAVAPALQVQAGREQGQREAILQQIALQHQKEQEDMLKAVQTQQIATGKSAAAESDALAAKHQWEVQHPNIAYGAPWTSATGDVFRPISRAPLGYDQPGGGGGQAGGPPSQQPTGPFTPPDIGASVVSALRGGGSPISTVPSAPPSGGVTAPSSGGTGPTPAPIRSTTMLPTGLKGQVKEPAQQFQNTQNGIMRWDRATQQLVSTGQKPYQAPDRAMLITQNPTDQTLQWTPRGQAAGMAASMPGGAMGKVRLSQAQSGASQMENADSRMIPYEDLLLAKKANITGWDAFKARVATDLHSHNLVGSVAITAALADLAQVNPDLTRYIRSGLEFAQGEGAAGNRTSDFRIMLSDLLATAGPYPSPQLISDIRSTRKAIYMPVRAALGGQPALYEPAPYQGAGDQPSAGGQGATATQRPGTPAVKPPGSWQDVIKPTTP